MWLKIPKYFTSDAQIWSTWSCQYKFSSSDIPRYCTDFTLVIGITSVWIQLKFLGTGLFFIWKNTKFVLSLLIDNLFATHQWYNFVNISRACLCAISRLLSLMIIAVSSAYNLTALCPMDLYKSFIYSKKNNGPNTEPCGTPHDAVRKSEFTPFMTVYWRLLVIIPIYTIKFHDLPYRTPSWSL